MQYMKGERFRIVNVEYLIYLTTHKVKVLYYSNNNCTALLLGRVTATSGKSYISPSRRTEKKDS